MRQIQIQFIDSPSNFLLKTRKSKLMSNSFEDDCVEEEETLKS